MILQTIRDCLPEVVRTREQDLLIGDTCLALTDKEREEIENVNFENYQYNSPQKTEISARIADAVHKSQLKGVAIGAAIGALGGGTIAWKLTNSIQVAALGGAAGGLVGGISGYHAGKKRGRKMVVSDITHSPEYRKWENEKYETIIFPALSRYMDPDQYENFELTCPITLGFMLEPVQASDNHIYEKSAILAHLAAWKQRWNSSETAFLSTENQVALLMASSPFRIYPITENTLKPLPNYYRNIFHELVNNYNSKVLEQQSIVDLAEKILEPLTEQAEKIVQLYSMTQRERTRIETRMRIALEDLPDTDLEDAYEFLTASAKLPRLLMPAG